MLCGAHPDSHLCFVSVGRSVPSGLYLSVCLQLVLVGWLRTGVDSSRSSLVFSCSALKTSSYFLGLLVQALPPLFKRRPESSRLPPEVCLPFRSSGSIWIPTAVTTLPSWGIASPLICWGMCVRVHVDTNNFLLFSLAQLIDAEMLKINKEPN